MTIDINVDAGEAFGHWRLVDETALFANVSSVNVACGFHAGDPETMRRTVKIARAAGLAVGAHPGFPDLRGFGRRDMAVSDDELFSDTLYQLGALEAMLREASLELHHVKPHGALYLKLLDDPALATAFCRAVKVFDSSLPVISLAGPGGEVMGEAARQLELPVIFEAFPDRGYLTTGKLAPRTMSGAVVHNPKTVAHNALTIVRDREVRTVEGRALSLEAHTLCLHGDHPRALENAAAVRRSLEEAGIAIASF